MSWQTTYNVGIVCASEEQADMVRDMIYDKGFDYAYVDPSEEPDNEVSGRIVESHYDVEGFFAQLTDRFPGTFVRAEYIDEDENIGVTYAKNGKAYSESAVVVYPDFDESRC